MMMKMEISTDEKYWGKLPSASEIDALKAIVLELGGSDIEIEIVPDDEVNSSQAKSLLDRAWNVFCSQNMDYLYFWPIGKG